MAAQQADSPSWSAALYLRFKSERTRPAHDLLAHVPLTSPRRIVDLGCGPGNSTAVLAARYPQAYLSGMDSSSEMIARAQQMLPGIVFKVDDLRTYMPSEPVDLIFSNAVLQWLAADERIPILTRLIRSQPSGGVFALQIPDNFHEPCHVAMRETAAQGCWATKLAALQLAREVPSPRELYDAVQPLCSQVDIWHTYYHHILDDHAAMVEWMKATGLRPFLAPLDDEERLGFLAAYLERLKESYRPLCDGKIMLNFPRLFLVAVRR